jgi:hypothetical protein
MSPSPLTLNAPTAAISSGVNPEHEQQVAKLTKALYPADRQKKFLELQAEVETLLNQLQVQKIRM